MALKGFINYNIMKCKEDPLNICKAVSNVSFCLILLVFC